MQPCIGPIRDSQPEGHAMEWKMVWNGWRILVWNVEDAQNGMEDLKNGMENLKNGMEDGLPYFHINYIDSPVCQNLQQNTKYYQTRMWIISQFSVLQCKFLACCGCIVLLR